MPKITLGITGVKKPIRDRLRMDSLLSPGLHYGSPVVSRFGKLHLNSHLSWPLSSTGLLPYKNTELAQAAVIQLGRVVQSWVKVTQG